jgi:hypothetical protein
MADPQARELSNAVQMAQGKDTFCETFKLQNLQHF